MEKQLEKARQAVARAQANYDKRATYVREQVLLGARQKLESIETKLALLAHGGIGTRKKPHLRMISNGRIYIRLSEPTGRGKRVRIWYSIAGRFKGGSIRLDPEILNYRMVELQSKYDMSGWDDLIKRSFESLRHSVS